MALHILDRSESSPSSGNSNKPGKPSDGLFKFNWEVVAAVFAAAEDATTPFNACCCIGIWVAVCSLLAIWPLSYRVP